MRFDIYLERYQRRDFAEQAIRLIRRTLYSFDRKYSWLLVSLTATESVSAAATACWCHWNKYTRLYTPVKFRGPHRNANSASI